MEQELAQFISQVGFPIVAFILMYRMVTNQMKENTDAINNNTKIISKLLVHLDLRKEGDDDGES